MLKMCLYDNGVFNIKDMVRKGASNEQLAEAVTAAIQHRAIDGWEADRNRTEKINVHESMATIGG